MQLGDSTVSELGDWEQKVGRAGTISLSLPFCPQFLYWDLLLFLGPRPRQWWLGGLCITSTSSLLGTLTPVVTQSPENSVFEKVLLSVLTTTAWGRADGQQMSVD